MAAYTDSSALCLDLASSCVGDGPADLNVMTGTDAASIWMPARLAFDRATGGTPRERWAEAAKHLADPHWLDAALAEHRMPVKAANG